MKILHITASYKPAYIYGGPTISISTLCEKLNKAGKTVEVITTTANGDSDFEYKNGEKILVEGVAVRYFKRWTKDHSHFSPSLLWFLFKNISNYSIIHIHAWWNLVSVGATFICWIKGRSIVFSPRGQLSKYSFNTNTTSLKKWFHQIIGNKILKNAQFQVSSRNEAEDIERLFPHPSTTVIWNFIDLADTGLTTAEKEASGPLKILFFSRIEQKKGLQFLLEALPYLNFEYTLNIYGEGEQEFIELLKSRIAKSEKNKVYWHGGVYGRKKFDVFTGNNILVLPSYAENFANVIIESLATGTAVMLTRSVGLADYVEQKNFGWICEQDCVEISKQLNEINSSRDQLQRIRNEAPLVIKSDFGEKTLTNCYLQFYEKLTNLKQ